ncbi:MAG: RNA polymerase sigma factor [Polyangiaceae bacterium]
MDPEEADLVARLRRGQSAALNEVYALYHARLWAFLLRLSGRRHVAEDLFQETWVAVARDAASLREDTDLRAWLFTVARNRYRSYRRWAVLDIARIFELGREPKVHAPSPEHEVEARADAQRTEAALASLSPEHREVLLLVVGEGMEAAAVGAVLGLSAEAVRQRLRRARLELSAAVEKRRGEGSLHRARGAVR